VHLDHLPGTFFGPSNLVELLQHRARTQPDDIAFTYLVDGENERIDLTYRQLDSHAKKIGAWLESHNMAGERALLLYPAGLEFIAAFFGCLYAGAIAVPVYPPRRNRSLNRIQSIADDADAKIALTTEQVYERVLPLIDETPHLTQLKWKTTSQLPPELEQQWTMPDVHGDTLAFLQYTSGSTGTPKGVVLSHANLVHNSALIACAFEHTRSGKGVFWLPSYHDMGLIGGILQPLYVGRPNVLMSPMSFLQKPYRWLSAITKYHGTTSGGPNFAYDLCVRKITPEQLKTLDLSSWRVAFNGAEPVRAETLDAFAKKFAPCGFRREAFYPCFGLAEATLIVSGGYVPDLPVIRTVSAKALQHGDVKEIERGSDDSHTLVGSGENLPDQRIAIVDPDTSTQVPANRIGEVWVQGPSMAQGYWQNAEATRRTFQAKLADTGDGPFMRTGDLGFMLDGELFITGRLKDLIIVRGVNYYPQDIEWTMQRSNPRLRADCGAAFVVEKDGREEFVVVQEVERHKRSNFDEVFDSIRKAIAREHDLTPDAIVLLRAGSIPKTSSNKIQRHACRDGYLASTLDVVGQWRIGDPIVVPAGQPAASQPAKTAASDSQNQSVPAAAAQEAASAAPVEPAKPTFQPIPTTDRLTQLVLEEIYKVAKDRAAGMTLDSPIVETGMDSLERMEILNALEEKFGGRFPEEILVELETTRQLVAAVGKYLGTEPRPESERPAKKEIPVSAYRFDQFPEYVKLRTSLDSMATLKVVNPFFTVHDGPTRDCTLVDGRKLINYSSYNYLGMSGDPRISAAAKATIDRYGTSASASRLVSGQKGIHVELENEFTKFLGTEDTIVMVGGHATNESVIGHLMGPGDLVLHDALAHNSIVEGAILSGARRRPFAHNDWVAAERLLEQYRHEYRRVLIAIEGVYSMDGDIPNLPRFIDVKKRNKAILLIDEAHSMGTLGATGRGCAEYFGVSRADVDIWMGTLSKTFGSCGGYISGCKELVEYLRYTLPGFVFAAAMAPPAAGAALASLRLLEAEPDRVTKLRENARLFLELAKAAGMNTGNSKDSPVVPIILGNSIHCLKLSQALFVRGVNVQPILHPAVEESASRLRFFITACHSKEQIRETVAIVAEELKKIDPNHLTHGGNVAAASQ
jgi:8-amino-7-oxononanoate synthase